MALLRSHGFSDVHFTHGAFEFGKDIIARSNGPDEQWVFQSKAGNIGVADWGSLIGQLDLLRRTEISHPGFDRDLPRRAALVLTGRLRGGAAPAAEDYARQAHEDGGTPLVVWDRERLIEMLAATPEAGLADTADGPLLELIGRIDDDRAPQEYLQRYSEKWVGGSTREGWKSLLEAGIIGTRLRTKERGDLACFTALGALRATWAGGHGEEPPSETSLAQRALAVRMFSAFAEELAAARTEAMLEPRSLIGGETEGVFVTYPARCLRIIEILGLFGLLLVESGEDERALDLAEWLARFIERQPGAARPLSDRWAIALIPPVLLLARTGNGDRAEPFLTDVARWLGDRHDNGEPGLAGFAADPLTEVSYLLGGTLEHVTIPERRQSYLASVLLDLAAALELPALYDLAFNEAAALDVRPMVTLARDDVDQYLVTGQGVRVPVNTSPRYVEYWTEGAEWRMAPHHDDDLSRYYLGRAGFVWDTLAINSLLRDRHWVAAMRRLARGDQVL